MCTIADRHLNKTQVCFCAVWLQVLLPFYYIQRHQPTVHHSRLGINAALLCLCVDPVINKNIQSQTLHLPSVSCTTVYRCNLLLKRCPFLSIKLPCNFLLNHELLHEQHRIGLYRLYRPYKDHQPSAGEVCSAVNSATHRAGR